MPAAKEAIFKADLEQALIEAYMQQPGVTFTPSLTPQLQKFCQLVHKTVVKYVTTPAFLYTGPIPPGSSNFGPSYSTIVHNLGYFPQVNPIEKYNFITSRYEVPAELVCKITAISDTTIVVFGVVGDPIRLTLW